MSQTLARRNGGVALLGAGPRRVVFFVAIAAWALCGRDYARGCYDAPAPRASGLHPCVNLGIVLPSARDRLGKFARAYCVENLAGTLPYLGQLNQLGGAGKLAPVVPLRPRAPALPARAPASLCAGAAPPATAGHTVLIRTDNAIFSTLTSKEKPGTVACTMLAWCWHGASRWLAVAYRGHAPAPAPAAPAITSGAPIESCRCAPACRSCGRCNAP